MVGYYTSNLLESLQWDSWTEYFKVTQLFRAAFHVLFRSLSLFLNFQFHCEDCFVELFLLSREAMGER